MKKLNAALCKDTIGNLKSSMAYRGITLSEEIYLQALEIALPVLERIETVESGLEGALKLHRLRTAEEGHSQLSDGFRAGARWAARFTALTQPQPSTNPQVDNDGWIERGGGGERSVHASSRVDVKFRNGVISRGDLAGSLRWSFTPDLPLHYDIIAYRVVDDDDGREG